MPAGTNCVSAETKLAMLRRKMEGGGRAALEDLQARLDRYLKAVNAQMPPELMPTVQRPAGSLVIFHFASTSGIVSS